MENSDGRRSFDMSKSELVEVAYEITGGNLSGLTLDQLRRLITITQHVTDLYLNEIERRGELTVLDGAPVVPYLRIYGRYDSDAKPDLTVTDTSFPDGGLGAELCSKMQT